VSRSYRWAWENESWPAFVVEVPDDSEVMVAETTYEASLPNNSVYPSNARAVTVKLVFIDSDADEDSERRNLRLIKERTS
jgi:hypothetical protein